MCIQNIYMLHDVLHVAPFPPQPWMAYITHPFSDLLNCGWQDIMLEHKRHHVATADVLVRAVAKAVGGAVAKAALGWLRGGREDPVLWSGSGLREPSMP